jgi:oligopeptide transport system substrate-binding protein
MGQIFFKTYGSFTMVREILLAGVCLISLGSAASAEIVLNRGNVMDPSTLYQQLTTTVL